jgi:hypothetical protein
VANSDGRAIRDAEQSRKNERKENKTKPKRFFGVLSFGKIEVENLKWKSFLVKWQFSFKIESTELRTFTKLIVHRFRKK